MAELSDWIDSDDFRYRHTASIAEMAKKNEPNLFRPPVSVYGMGLIKKAEELRRQSAAFMAQQEEQRRKEAEKQKQVSESLAKVFFSYADIGRELALRWGKSGKATVAEQARSASQDDRMICLLAQMVAQMNSLPYEIARAMDRRSQAEHKRAMAIERAKQKTARMEREAKEAQPPKVTIIQSSNEDLEKAWRNGRVKRRF